MSNHWATTKLPGVASALGVLVIGLGLAATCTVAHESSRYAPPGTFHTTDLLVDNTANVGGVSTLAEVRSNCTATGAVGEVCVDNELAATSTSPVVNITTKSQCTGTFDTTGAQSACIGGLFRATATRSAGGNPVENTALEVVATGGQNNEALLGDDGDFWQQEFAAGTRSAIFLRTEVAGLTIGGGTLPFGAGAGPLPNVGQVDLSGADIVTLGNKVDSFAMIPPASGTALLKLGQPAASPGTSGMNLQIKNTNNTSAFMGVELGGDTTVNAGVRPTQIWWRCPGGIGGCAVEGIIGLAAGSGFPLVGMAANDFGIAIEGGGAIVFGADNSGFTAVTEIKQSNHWIQMTSTGLPGLGGGCTSGGGSSIVGNDKRFEVVMGASSTSCVVTFVKTFTTKPMCTVTSLGGIAFPNVTPAAATFTFTTNVNSGDYVVDCDGQPGGT